MAYALKPGKPPAKRVRKLLLRQMRTLREQLGRGVEATDGFHDARKSVKRARALLILARPSLGEAWRQMDRAWRDLGRRLSSMRDAQVMAGILSRVERERGAAFLGEAGAHMRAGLAAQRAQGEKVDIEAVTAMLQMCEQNVALLPDGLGVGELLDGLAADYKGGRHALEQARGTGSAEEWHELRKHVQRHQRHMQLFAPAWPEEMATRLGLAKVVAEALGEDHDLWMLGEGLRGLDPVTLTDGSLERLLDHCRAGETALRERAAAAAERLLAERPKALRARLLAYWQAQPIPAAAAEQDPKRIASRGQRRAAARQET